MKVCNAMVSIIRKGFEAHYTVTDDNENKEPLK